MKLVFRRLAAYPFKPVEEVVYEGWIIGLLERQPGRPVRYKAFSGFADNCRYLHKCCSKKQAVDAILKTHGL